LLNTTKTYIPQQIIPNVIPVFVSYIAIIGKIRMAMIMMGFVSSKKSVNVSKLTSLLSRSAFPKMQTLLQFSNGIKVLTILLGIIINIACRKNIAPSVVVRADDFNLWRCPTLPILFIFSSGKSQLMTLMLAAVWHCLRIIYAKPIFEDGQIGTD